MQAKMTDNGSIFTAHSQDEVYTLLAILAEKYEKGEIADVQIDITVRFKKSGE